MRPQRGVLAWFASNPVAANLLMVLILIGGVYGYNIVDQEVFPRFFPQQINISVDIPGAGPTAIEESVVVPIENAIHDVAGVQKIAARIQQGSAVLTVTVTPGTALEPVLNTLQGRVQGLPRLPSQLERMVVFPAQRNDDDGVIWVSLHGQADPLALQRYGASIQAEIERIAGVQRVRNYFEAAYEIAITIPSLTLQHYGLSLAEVSAAIRRSSLDQSLGVVKSPAGQLQLRIKDKADDVRRLSTIVLRSNTDGSRVTLGDIAVIHDGLEERLSEWHYNGLPAQGWEIHTKNSSVDVARRVKASVAQLQQQLPEGLELSTWWDDSSAYQERVHTLVEDGLSGFILVCLVLTLFLQLRVAVWAGVGIFTSVLGALWLMPMVDVSLNMLSLFGFLLAMGILVDDAIIIGDSIYAHQQTCKPDDPAAYLRAAIAGVTAVALPVCLSVMVALVAFLPGLFLPGWAGQMMQPICWVMILTLVFSLVEALLILPAHLATPSRLSRVPSALARLRGRMNSGLEQLVRRYYQPFLQTALAWRYLTIAAFMVLVLLCAAWVQSGRIRMSVQADVVKDSFWVTLKIPQELPYSAARDYAQQIEQAYFSLRDEAGSENFALGLETIVWEHGVDLWLEFSPEARASIRVEDFIKEWRKRIGDLGRAKIEFLYKEGDQPYDLDFEVTASTPELLPKGSAALKNLLAHMPGVYDAVDSIEPGLPEIQLRLKPWAEHLGIRLEDLATQVRAAYFGETATRLTRGRHEVKVVLRLPSAERVSVDSLANLPIKLAAGGFTPLSNLADISLSPGVDTVLRQNRQRLLKVNARVDTQLADTQALYAAVTAQLPAIERQYPGLHIDIGQERQDQLDLTATLKNNTLMALLVIYILIAIPFRSYLKPLIFLLAAPVAWCGAVIAHGIAGLPLSMESLVGMIAASGVVVNDSLVLLDYLKDHEHAHQPLSELICAACTARFRPIMLAFLTNFAGFLPTLLETSPQAQFLIPMTLSLSAGLLVGMAASLLLTPVCYAVLGKR